jgi:hypothetical protein
VSHDARDYLLNQVEPRGRALASLLRDRGETVDAVVNLLCTADVEYIPPGPRLRYADIPRVLTTTEIADLLMDEQRWAESSSQSVQKRSHRLDRIIRDDLRRACNTGAAGRNAINGGALVACLPHLGAGPMWRMRVPQLLGKVAEIRKDVTLPDAADGHLLRQFVDSVGRYDKHIEETGVFL